MSGFNPFGKKPTAKEQAKQVKRGVRSSQRDLDRELRDLDRREQQIIADLKKEAKLGRSEKAVKLLAKNLVQLRAQRERVLGAKVQVGSVATQASAMAASVAVADSVGAAGKAMGAMNKTMAKANVGLSIAQFQRETERMNMTEEMMGDMLSDAFDTDEIDPVYEGIFPVEKVTGFMKPLQCRMLVAKLKQNEPIMFSHCIGGSTDEVSHIRYLIAPVNADAD